jgi:hypothetical protein
MSDSFDVIMAACPAADSTLRDFDDALVELVKRKTVKSEGVILVELAADGRVRGDPGRRPPGPQGSGVEGRGVEEGLHEHAKVQAAGHGAAG